MQNKNSIKRKIAKSAWKDAKDIFETIKLSKKPKISFTDTVFIIIRVTYSTEVFRNARNIERAHQVAYQKIISEGNYLKLSKEEMVI